jgi:glycosyltransferase involved in cell wall biosynthesis
MSRILLISHIFPPAIDGGSHVVYKLGEYFASQGHTIVTLSSDVSSTDDFTHSYQSLHSTPKTVNDKIIISHRLPVYTFLHRPLKLLSKLLPFFSVFSKGPIFKFVPIFKFIFFYLKFRPNYIIAGPLPTTIILYARFLRFLSRLFSLNTKLIINASFHPTDKEFHNYFLVNTLKSADFVWTLTDFETNYFHKNFNIAKSKMINVGNGVDSTLITKIPHPKSRNTLNLLYIGSFASHKGIETLIDAYTMLFKHQKRLPYKVLTLTLAGQPTLYSPVIESKIASLPTKVRSNIKIIYKFKTKELGPLLDQSTILISPSTQESFGLVLLEAMSRGVPVIGANIPASSELISRSSAGLTFKVGNADNLAKKIILIQNSKVYQLYSSNGLSYALDHTWDKIGKNIWQKIS